MGNSLMRWGGHCLSAAVLLALAAGGDTLAAQGPLIIAKQGSFYAGGTVRNITRRLIQIVARETT